MHHLIFNASQWDKDKVQNDFLCIIGEKKNGLSMSWNFQLNQRTVKKNNNLRKGFPKIIAEIFEKLRMTC